MSANPYQPPEANLVDAPIDTSVELADRGQRFGAALIDGILGMVVGVPIIILLGTYDYMRRGQQPPFTLLIAGAVLGFVGFLVLHGYYLKTFGQTIGKKLLGIRIADLQGNVPDFMRLIALRYLPISVASLIPIVGVLYPLIDVLFIFRDDRRCIHDLIAGTRVLKGVNVRPARA